MRNRCDWVNLASVCVDDSIDRLLLLIHFLGSLNQFFLTKEQQVRVCRPKDSSF